jgi:protein XagA
MNRSVTLSLLALVTGVAPAVPAAAQAFTQAEGKGRVISSVIYSRSTRGFDDDGHVRDIPDYEKLEVYLLGEYGVTDALTLLATPSFRDVQVRGEEDSTGLGFTDFGARYRVAAGGRFTLAVQGLVRIPGQTRRDRLAQVGQTDMEYDLRAQGAVTFKGGHFAIVEGGYRWSSGDPPDQVNIDATLGVRATPRLLLLASTYNSLSDGAGRDIFRPYRYHNAYFSAAYDLSPAVTLQVGALGTMAGRNALRERGAFGGVWFRF